MNALPFTVRRGVLASGAALVMAASAIGFAAAQTPPPTPPATSDQVRHARPNHQAFLDALAQRLGVSSQRLEEAMAETRAELGLPEHKRDGGPGRQGGGHLKFGKFGPALSVLTDTLGITPAQLREELPGHSLAEIAQAHGKNPSDVATALKNAANQRIDQAVASGRVTAEQATQLKQRAAEGIDRLMNQVVPEDGFRKWGPGPRGERDGARDATFRSGPGI